MKTEIQAALEAIKTYKAETNGETEVTAVARAKLMQNKLVAAKIGVGLTVDQIKDILIQNQNG